mgnify:CR=1 FL=1
MYYIWHTAEATPTDRHPHHIDNDCMFIQPIIAIQSSPGMRVFRDKNPFANLSAWGKWNEHIIMIPDMKASQRE